MTVKFPALLALFLSSLCSDSLDCAYVPEVSAITVSAGENVQLFEDQLGRGSASIMKGLRRATGKTWKTIVGSAGWWQKWIPGIGLALLMLLIVPALDRSLLSTWRERGLSAARASLLLGIAIYVRLIFDRRA